MRNYPNNFFNVKKLNNQLDYQLISEKMANLHSLCFKNSIETFTTNKMFSLLKDQRYHVFFNEISLAIILVLESEADIITLMVNPLERKTGIASQLLDLVTLYLKNLGVQKLFLEVDAKNNLASKIYNKLGFTLCGIRKNYYLQNDGLRHDASVMVIYLSKKKGSLDKKKLQRLYPTG